MKHPFVVRASRVGAAALLIIFSGAAAGAGFAIIEQSVKGLGAAFSNSAGAADASTVYFNPAGLTNLTGTQIQTAGHIVAPSSEYTDQGSSLNPALGAFTPITGVATGAGSLAGNDGGNAGVTGLIPNLYVHKQLDGILDGRLHVGVGINAPFALKTNYDEGWVGRYHALTSSVHTKNFNPSLGFQVNDWLSVGGGFSAQYIEARLSQAVDQSSACVAGVGAAAAPGGAAAVAAALGAVCAPAGLLTPGNVAADANADLRNARDWSFGWNLGVQLHPTKSTRVGIHYRSKISHRLEGTAVFSRVNPTALGLSLASATVTDLVNQRATAKVTLPESASVNLYHAFNERWAVHGDVSWTRWSRIQNLQIDFADTTRSTLIFDWDNSFRYSAGLTFKPNDTWTLRAGGAFDETPIPDAARRSARIPGEDRTWITAGASYRFSEHLSVDAGYAYLFVDDPKIANVNESTGHTLIGEYDADVHIASVQAVYRF